MNRTDALSVLVLAFVVVLLGCQNERADTTAWLEDLPRLSLEEVDRFDEPLFGSISAIATDAEGRVYVADGQALQISAFDADGSFLYTVGESGDGPGEFSFLSDLAVFNDTLYAYDSMARRMNLWPTGSPELGRM